MYKISIIVCIVLMVVFVGVLMWENNRDKQLDEQLEEAIADYLLIESKRKPMIIEVTETKEGETLILTYEEARELEWEFPTGSRTFMFRNMAWPITQTHAIREFIEWLYENDYAIVKKK